MKCGKSNFMHDPIQLLCRMGERKEMKTLQTCFDNRHVYAPMKKVPDICLHEACDKHVLACDVSYGDNQP